MPRPLRAVALFAAFIIGVLTLSMSVTGAPVAVAAARPTVTAVGSGAGPLKPSTVTIHGADLGGATAVKFGKRKGKVLRRVSATELEVRTPKGLVPERCPSA